jgi:hypothetical protein
MRWYCLPATLFACDATGREKTVKARDSLKVQLSDLLDHRIAVLSGVVPSLSDPLVKQAVERTVANLKDIREAYVRQSVRPSIAVSLQIERLEELRVSVEKQGDWLIRYIADNSVPKIDRNAPMGLQNTEGSCFINMIVQSLLPLNEVNEITASIPNNQLRHALQNLLISQRSGTVTEFSTAVRIALGEEIMYADGMSITDTMQLLRDHIPGLNMRMAIIQDQGWRSFEDRCDFWECTGNFPNLRHTGEYGEYLLVDTVHACDTPYVCLGERSPLKIALASMVYKPVSVMLQRDSMTDDFYHSWARVKVGSQWYDVDDSMVREIEADPHDLKILSQSDAQAKAAIDKHTIAVVYNREGPKIATDYDNSCKLDAYLPAFSNIPSIANLAPSLETLRLFQSEVLSDHPCAPRRDMNIWSALSVYTHLVDSADAHSALNDIESAIRETAASAVYPILLHPLDTGVNTGNLLAPVVIYVFTTTAPNVESYQTATGVRYNLRATIQKDARSVWTHYKNNSGGWVSTYRGRRVAVKGEAVNDQTTSVIYESESVHWTHYYNSQN